MEEVLSHALENTLGSFEFSLGAADHESESAIVGACDTAGHRRVQIVEASIPGCLVELASTIRMDGAGIADVGALVCAVKDATVLCESLLDVVSLRKSSNDVLNICADLGERVDWLNTDGCCSFASLRRKVETFDVVSVLD